MSMGEITTRLEFELNPPSYTFPTWKDLFSQTIWEGHPNLVDAKLAWKERKKEPKEDYEFLLVTGRILKEWPFISCRYHIPLGFIT
jgi:hypothetical protein